MDLVPSATDYFQEPLVKMNYPVVMHYDYVGRLGLFGLLDEKVLAGDKLRNTRSNTEVGRATRLSLLHESKSIT
jgi:hypothetical protein